MADPRGEPHWRSAVDVPLIVLATATVLSLIRSIDQPSFSLEIAGTEVAFVLADAALAVLAAFCLQRLLGRGSLPRPARAVTLAAAAFSTWLFLSSAANGADAVIAAAKLLEYGVLALGFVLFVRRRLQLWLLVGVLVAFTVAAVGYGLLAFFDAPFVDSRFPTRRQPSFLGEHDLAALSTMTLAVALVALYTPAHRLGRLPLVAGVAGAIGVVLGAAVAGLLGLYLAVAAIVAVALLRGAATKRAVGLTMAVTAAITIGVLSLRSGELGAFFRSIGIGEAQNDAFGNSASWNERLIDAYIGGRIFLDNPIVGTGWHGELPPDEYARFIDDARAHFPDQPATYFPSDDGFIPQQTYDQVLYELGIVGALLFLVLAAVTVRTAARVARSWPHDDPDEPAAYLPAAWIAALAGGLTGAALFGGIPLAAIFWITIGVTALTPSLAPPAPPPERS
jgi:O-antigen ligase/polysaccharide polymerase Wzy-like membrane protein